MKARVGVRGRRHCGKRVTARDGPLRVAVRGGMICRRHYHIDRVDAARRLRQQDGRRACAAFDDGVWRFDARVSAVGAQCACGSGASPSARVKVRVLAAREADASVMLVPPQGAR